MFHLPGWFAKKGGSARGPVATFLDIIRKSGKLIERKEDENKIAKGTNV